MTADQLARWRAFYRLEAEFEHEAYERAKFQARADRAT
jgi:hypothetical protein